MGHTLGELLQEICAILTSMASTSTKKYAYPSVSAHGCVVRTVMVITWNGMDTVIMNYQYTSVSGGSPALLVMENDIRLGADLPFCYYNSKEVSLPNGTYNLTSPYSDTVGESAMSQLTSRGIVYFNGGSSIVSSVSFDPAGYPPPEVQ